MTQVPVKVQTHPNGRERWPIANWSSWTLWKGLAAMWAEDSRREKRLTGGRAKPTYWFPFLFISKPLVFSCYIDLFGVENILIGWLGLSKFEALRLLSNLTADCKATHLLFFGYGLTSRHNSISPDYRVSSPHTAIAANDDSLCQISTKNLSCGTDGLFTPLNLFLLCLTGVCQMYSGIKCRFALAICIRE